MVHVFIVVPIKNIEYLSYMKYCVALLFLLHCCIVGAQKMFDYEREINNKERYSFQELEFSNVQEDIKLSGTLITPKAPFNKVVIIIPGSGKDTRYAHFVLAEAFLNDNIAVYRFDERGVGRSTGSFNPSASSLTADVSYAVETLRNVEVLKSCTLGLVGHSLGGMAAIAAHDRGTSVDFLIQLAAPVEKHGAFFKYQTKNNLMDFYRIKGKSQEEVVQLLDLLYPIIINNNDYGIIRNKGKMAARENGFKSEFYKFLSPTHIDHVKQNYEHAYESTRIPILYLIGSNDLYVDPVTETSLLKSFDNPLISVTVFDGLNHYLTLQNAPSGTSLYQVDSQVLETILKWTKHL